MAVDTELKPSHRYLSVAFGGAEVQLVFKVFMDDIVAPDVYFFSDDERLAKALQLPMQQFADENEI